MSTTTETTLIGTTVHRPCFVNETRDTFRGIKFIRGRELKAIAVDIRHDIRAAVNRGDLPRAAYSVRTSRQQITITVSRYTYLLRNPLRVASDLRCEQPAGPTLYWESTAARTVRHQLESIAMQYQFREHHAQSDYYHSNFGIDVNHAENLGEYESLRSLAQRGFIIREKAHA